MQELQTSDYSFKIARRYDCEETQMETRQLNIKTEISHIGTNKSAYVI